MTGDDTDRDAGLGGEQTTTAVFDEGATVGPEAPARRRPRSLLVAMLLALLLLVASAGWATWLYLGEYRHDQAVGDAAKTRVIAAATDGTVALLSYSPETLDKDFTAAKTHLTGDFLN